MPDQSTAGAMPLSFYSRVIPRAMACGATRRGIAPGAGGIECRHREGNNLHCQLFLSRPLHSFKPSRICLKNPIRSVREALPLSSPPFHHRTCQSVHQFASPRSTSPDPTDQPEVHGTYLITGFGTAPMLQLPGVDGFTGCCRCEARRKRARGTRCSPPRRTS